VDWPIIREFPLPFAEFLAKRWALLWLANRDRFYAAEFHSRADTLTLSL
jgi:hypothetical protein